MSHQRKEPNAVVRHARNLEGQTASNAINGRCYCDKTQANLGIYELFG